MAQLLAALAIGMACAYLIHGSGEAQRSPTSVPVPGDLPFNPIARHSTTLAEIQAQLSEQFRDQCVHVSFESVRIVAIEKPEVAGGLSLLLNVQWTATKSTTSIVHLYPVAGRYLAGTYRVDRNPLPVNLLVAMD